MHPVGRAVTALLGIPRPPLEVRPLRGGTKKGVWRVTLPDGGGVVAYLWHPDHDHWPAGEAPPDPADPFSHASGPDLFTAARSLLVRDGVRVPELLALDATGAQGPGVLAVVEDVGPTLEHLMGADPARAVRALDHLAGTLRTLHGRTHPSFGKVAHLASGGVPPGGSCHEVVLGRALVDLDEAARREERVRADRDRLAEMLYAFAARVEPRGGGHRLIHGELGPDHVLVSGDDEGGAHRHRGAHVLRCRVGARLRAVAVR
ncbi:phosphotransferase [Nocardiopsis lambiniae]|uniref:Phosphotransferase n=1 Tax=Nocardiopsis lambiniae TaxID=3075539 RepID=A0ABU2MHA8_9ACTN|nr:phosphotransferase [Nocardiopsis sp. DSM 44743]MDT0332099.1 phosphotransferase [Nocardiopsis sp. DSM 44743]